MEPIYLDHAATTPLDPDVREAMLPWLGDGYGNPSSVHSLGRRARAAVDEARDRVAAAAGCAAREVVFTSGGTEADNLALRGILERWGPERGRHLVVSAVEHEAVLATARSLATSSAAALTVVGCDRLGRVDPAEVAAAVRPDTVLVSVMLANNEVGTVEPVAEIAHAVRARNPKTLVHTDAVQALGRLPLELAGFGVDLLSVSAHKAYGPKGVGALVARQGVFLTAQISGGGQERDRRSGTENVACLAGFGVAAQRAHERRDADARHAIDLAGRLTNLLTGLVPGIQPTGDPDHRLPGLASFAVPGCRSDLLLAVLDEMGICASAGSACSSGAPVASHVLGAMGYGDLAGCALRLSVGRSTTAADVAEAARLVAAAVSQVRGGGSDHAAGRARATPSVDRL
ncbi:MAG: cysteine desulfurase family protein [Candidatus Dormibacteria bacterium]|jgi:cysteine desulfurase